jgi:hypothetical protein
MWTHDETGSVSDPAKDSTIVACAGTLEGSAAVPETEK